MIRSTPKRKRKQDESAIQQAYFKEVFLREQFDWRYKLIFSVPNQGVRTVRNASRLKAEGMRAGLPDVIGAVPIGQYCGFVIEVKTKIGKVSARQADMLNHFKKAGFATFIARSVDAMTLITRKYLAGEL